MTFITSDKAEDSCLKNHNEPPGNALGDQSDVEKSQRGMNADSTQGNEDTSSTRTAASPDPLPDTYPEGGLTAWLVTFGAFCGMGAVFGLINSAGVFESYFAGHQLAEYSRSQIGWIFSLYLFLVFFVGIQVGPIFDLYGSRALVAIASVFIVGSLMLLSVSDEYYQIMLTYSVMGGIGGAMLNCPCYGSIAHFFNLRRGFATGIATIAGGLGGILFPLLLQHLLGPDGVGFGWSCRAVGFILLGLCVFANLFIRTRLSSRIGPDGQPRKKSVWPDFTIFKHKGYALTTAGVFFMEWGLFIPITYVVSYAHAHGQTEQDGSILLAILNAGSVFGRFLPGLLADKLGRFNVIIGTITLCVITVIGLWLPAEDSKAILIVFCVTFGFASGSNLGLFPVCIGQFCDAKDYGRYFTTATLIASFGTLSSVPIGGALLGYEGRRGWVALILFSGVSYSLAVVCFTAARITATGWKLWAKF